MSSEHVFINEMLFKEVDKHFDNTKLIYSDQPEAVGVAYDTALLSDGTPYVAYINTERGDIRAFLSYESFDEAVHNAQRLFRGKIGFEKYIHTEQQEYDTHGMVELGKKIASTINSKKKGKPNALKPAWGQVAKISTEKNYYKPRIGDAICTIDSDGETRRFSIAARKIEEGTFVWKLAPVSVKNTPLVAKLTDYTELKKQGDGYVVMKNGTSKIVDVQKYGIVDNNKSAEIK